MLYFWKTNSFIGLTSREIEKQGNLVVVDKMGILVQKMQRGDILLHFRTFILVLSPFYNVRFYVE
jgi:hypothetical protein